MASTGKIRQEVVDYMDRAALASLATVRGDGTPVIRTIGAFAVGNDGTSIYFATQPEAEKTRHISGNSKVSFFFQHEGQQLPAFRNAEVLGTAARITDGADLGRVAGLISARSPYIKEQIAKSGIGFFAFYEVRAAEVKFLDYSKGIGPQAIETFVL